MKMQTFYNFDQHLELLVSPKNPEHRDFIEIPRLQLLQGTGEGKTVLTVSEDWDVVQAKIEEVTG